MTITATSDAAIIPTDRGPYCPAGRFHVDPVAPVELAFEGIWQNARRKSGLGVRFPRIVRWREDKPVSEADTLDSARALLTAT